MKLQEITIFGPVKYQGSKQITWNVRLAGAPFGQIWTFKAKGEKHGFHASTLAGFYGLFDSLAAAEAAVRGEM